MSDGDKEIEETLPKKGIFFSIPVSFIISLLLWLSGKLRRKG